MNILKNIFNHFKTAYSEPTITVEKLQHIFDYFNLKNLTGTADYTLENQKIGHLINYQKEHFRKEFGNIPAQTVPQHIQWSNNPVFAFVAIVDNKIQYHFSENGESAIFLCPQTTNSNHIKLIDEIFEHYYQNFNLPNALIETNIEKQKFDKADKMAFLTAYLQSKNSTFFEDYFCNDDNDDIYSIAMWIDWREEDESIIDYCEKILQTKQLSVECVEAENERRFDILISYKGQQTSIPYQGIGSDRDTTIRTLSNIIQPEYEIRLCKESIGGDSLCFVPLSSSQWNELDNQFSLQMIEKFIKITGDTIMFG